MRPHGRANIDPASPRARAVCDHCGMIYNHYHLRWQYDWRGPRLQNLRFLVCPTCYDTYQQNGQRTIILPPDPVPIMNPRIEYYVQDDNPLSAIGGPPNALLPFTDGIRIGTLTAAGGIDAAFDGVLSKPARRCATITVSDSSFGNYAGVNWTGVYPINVPSSSPAPTVAHTLSTFAIYAPSDSTFGATAYLVQGSSLGSSTFANWTTLSSGTAAGTVGETITGTAAGGPYQYHRVAFSGDGINPIRIAQIQLSVSDGGSN